MFLILSVFTGFLVAVMIQLNGQLQIASGGVLALLSIHLCGLGGALLLLMFTGKRSTGDPARKSPAIFLAAGMLGTLIVYLASVIFEKGGILFSLSGSLAGQTLAASLAESFYTTDRKRSPVLQRILSPALLLPGSIIIGLKVGASVPWIILSWTPGVVLMLQQTMNSHNTLRYGTPKTVVYNYVSALILIIPLFLLSSEAGSNSIAAVAADSISVLSELPWQVVAGGGLIGVFTTGAIAFMLLKAPALLVVLGIYTGEIAGGILLDLYNGNPVAVEKLIGIILIAGGLAAGKIGAGRKQAA